MIKLNLFHPEILEAIAGNGHGAKVLIADGNFPISTKTPPACKKVFLNLAPDLLTVTAVLKVIKEYVPIESYSVMATPDETDQPIHQEFRKILGTDISLQKLKRAEFYQASADEEVCLAIATGETRRFANILLVIGVVIPG